MRSWTGLMRYFPTCNVEGSRWGNLGVSSMVSQRESMGIASIAQGVASIAQPIA